MHLMFSSRAHVVIMQRFSACLRYVGQGCGVVQAGSQAGCKSFHHLISSHPHSRPHSRPRRSYIAVASHCATVGYSVSLTSMSCLVLLSCLFIYNFQIFKTISFFPSLGHVLSVSHHIVHRLSWSTLFPAAATGLSSHVFSPTLASRPSRTRTSTNAVDKLFLRTRSPLISLPFKFITLISSYQRT